MSTFTAKMLADLYLPSTKGDILATGSVARLVHSITLHNTNSTTEVVELYYHNGSTEKRIFKGSLPADDMVIISWPNEGLPIASTCKITGLTTTASKVTCLISGSEVS